MPSSLQEAMHSDNHSLKIGTWSQVLSVIGLQESGFVLVPALLGHYLTSCTQASTPVKWV
jgi:hypothetical protein